VPRECTGAALAEGVNDMTGFVPFIATLSINATIGMPPPCAFDPFETQFCANAYAKRDYFDALYQVSVLPVTLKMLKSLLSGSCLPKLICYWV